MSAAILLAIAPDRNVVSRTAVVSTCSATRAIADPGKFVIATVVAPCLRASWRLPTVSAVIPVCEIPMATSPRRSSAAEVTATCGSGQA